VGGEFMKNGRLNEVGDRLFPTYGNASEGTVQKKQSSYMNRHVQSLRGGGGGG
jgi:hypothetical protein